MLHLTWRSLRSILVQKKNSVYFNNSFLVHTVQKQEDGAYRVAEKVENKVRQWHHDSVDSSLAVDLEKSLHYAEALNILMK